MKLDLLSLSDLERDTGLELGKDYFLVTYHPVTLGNDPAGAVGEMLAALDEFSGHRVIVTGVNADPGHEKVSRLLSNYATKNPERVSLRESLGQLRYLSAMKHAAAVIGNSSSGIIEAPALGVPTVNLGDRQRGRVRSASILDCAEKAVDIAAAIRKALSGEFLETMKTAVNPYGDGGASRQIKDLLKSADLSNILMKRFHNIPVPA